MKFGQLIECNMRNIFLEKSYTKCGRKASPRPFVCQVEGYPNILKLSCGAFPSTHIRLFLKIKRGLEPVSPA